MKKLFTTLMASAAVLAATAVGVAPANKGDSVNWGGVSRGTLGSVNWGAPAPGSDSVNWGFNALGKAQASVNWGAPAPGNDSVNWGFHATNTSASVNWGAPDPGSDSVNWG